MMKKNLKHVAAIVLLVGFAVFALGSMGSSPSSGGGGYSGGGGSSSSSTRCPEANTCRFYVFPDGTWMWNKCSRSSCRARGDGTGFDTTPGINITCDCP